MRTDHPELSKIFSDCAKKARLTTNTCLFPGCNKTSIKSHIMQKNGILSSISEDRHLWEFNVDHFKKEYITFKKTGINEIYTFLGFCNEHDSGLFQKIETQGEIDFEDYEACSLFALRTLCNEKWLKLVVKKQHQCVLNHPKTISDILLINKVIEQGDIALQDLKFFGDSLWDDLNNKTESFIFEWREFPKQEICLNSIFTYDTSEEIINHIKIFGIDKERLVEIFVSFFPYQDKSILIMGYHKDDIKVAKPFVNSFMREKLKRVYRKLSNLIILNCETWVCSHNFYKKKLEGLDSDFFKATIFSTKNENERRVFDINLFEDNFKERFKKFIKKIG
ncbi:hypothetical protein [Flavobacterium sp. J27]|uniref:hypothetical protein n=1 Tax=Flavobacterium sp. J27 TaxID=2060419 RepID=UPI0010319054|nr:hypothetical protein [Flavobacterium sp. J27]